MSTCLMGIDIGLTKIKVGIIDEGGNTLTIRRCTPNTIYPHPGHCERNPGDMWDGVKMCIREALQDVGILGQEVEAVGLCGHGDGLIMLDENKEPLRNAILTADERTRTLVQKWMEDSICPGSVLPGILFRLGNPLPLLAWVRRNEPDNYRKMRWLTFAKDWIRVKMTGHLCTDRTDASAVLIKGGTSKEARALLEACELEDVWGKIPPIVDGTSICGHVTSLAAQETGLRAGTPVVGGFLDTASCALASGCLSDGDVYVGLGTWGVNAVVRRNLARDSKGDVSLRAYAYSLPDYWLLTASTPGSAGSLDWYIHNFYATTDKEQVSEESVYVYCDREVSKIEPGSSGIIYHPYLYGSNLGREMQAGFLGLKEFHEKAHLLRAVYEGVAFNHRQRIEVLEETGAIRRIHLGGGGARSREWSQIFADVLGRKVYVPENEPGIRGAVIAASIGTGLYSTFEEAVSHIGRIDRTHMPTKDNSAAYQKRYEFFLKSIEVVSELWN